MKYLLLLLIPLLFAANLYAAPVTLTWQGGLDCSHEMRLQLEDGSWKPINITVPGIFELLIETDGFKAAQVWGKNAFGYSKNGSNILKFDLPPDPTSGSLQVKKKKPLSWFRNPFNRNRNRNHS